MKTWSRCTCEQVASREGDTRKQEERGNKESLKNRRSILRAVGFLVWAGAVGTMYGRWQCAVSAGDAARRSAQA